MLPLNMSTSKAIRRFHESVRALLLRDQRGATLIEYGLISGMIAALLILLLMASGNSLVDIFTTIQQALIPGAL